MESIKFLNFLIKKNVISTFCWQITNGFYFDALSPFHDNLTVYNRIDVRTNMRVPCP